MLNYQTASSDADITFERVGDALTIRLPKEGFVRGAGALLRSRHFWMYIAIFLAAMNFGHVIHLARIGLRGNVPAFHVTAESVALVLFQPAAVICVYLSMVSQNNATIGLFQTKLGYTVHGIFGTTREKTYDRGDLDGVRVGWIDLSITSSRRFRFPFCRRRVLFAGRTREERERVATVIRNWIEQTPAEQRR